MQIEIDKGVSFYEAFKQSKEAMNNTGTSYVEFEFNGIWISIQRASVFVDIAEVYDLKCKIRRLEGK